MNYSYQELVNQAVRMIKQYPGGYMQALAAGEDVDLVTTIVHKLRTDADFVDEVTDVLENA